MKMYVSVMIAVALTATGLFAKEGVYPQSATSHTYIIKSGDTLDSIAHKKYGDSHYSSLLIIHNEIKDVTKLRVRHDKE